MVTKWLVRWNCLVEKTIERETKACYWIDGYRVRKNLAYSKWFDTEAEAKAELVLQFQRKIDSAEANIVKYKKLMEKYS